MKVFASLLLVAAADPTCTQRAASSCQFADGQTIQLTQVYCGALEEVHITGSLTTDDNPNGNHGFHVHTYKPVNGDCSTAGGHFSTDKQIHAHPSFANRYFSLIIRAWSVQKRTFDFLKI